MPCPRRYIPFTVLHIPLSERQYEYSPHPIHPNFWMNGMHSIITPLLKPIF
jgi:hypothetical protein